MKNRRLNEASTVSYATIHGDEGIPVIVRQDGIQFVKVESERGYFSMTGAVLAPVTEEMLRAWETDSIQFEADYYWEMFRDHYTQFGEFEEYAGMEWDEIPESEQETLMDRMVEDSVRGKLDGMSGDFTYQVDGGEAEDYYLDMIAAGQVMLNGGGDGINLIPQRELDILQAAWDKYHLKDAGEFETADEVKLANKVYQKYKDNEELLIKAIKVYQSRFTDSEEFDALMRSLEPNQPGGGPQMEIPFGESKMKNEERNFKYNTPLRERFSKTNLMENYRRIMGASANKHILTEGKLNEEEQNWDTAELSRWMWNDEGVYNDILNAYDVDELENILRQSFEGSEYLDIDWNAVDFDSLFDEVKDDPEWQGAGGDDEYFEEQKLTEMPRKVTETVVDAFLSGQSKKVGNTHTDGQSLYLHNNEIAKIEDGVLWITNAGWESNTTKERLNALPGVSIQQKNYVWYLGGEEWDGDWTEIGPVDQLEDPYWRR